MSNITPKEAIERLTYIKTHQIDPEDYEVFDLAIKALEQAEVKSDLISREALKTDLRQYFTDGVLDGVSAKLAFNQILHDIDNAQAVEYTFEEAFQKTVCENRLYCPARPKGEWIIDGHHRRCKKCGEYFCIADSEGNEIPSNFCPNCGAEMKGGAENG